MVSYLLRCRLQRGYLSSYRFMLPFRDIYITLSSLGVPALVRGTQSCRDPGLPTPASTTSSTSTSRKKWKCNDCYCFREHMLSGLKQNGIWLDEPAFTWTRSRPPQRLTLHLRHSNSNDFLVFFFLHPTIYIYVPPVWWPGCILWTFNIQRVLAYSNHKEPWSERILSFYPTDALMVPNRFLTACQWSSCHSHQLPVR